MLPDSNAQLFYQFGRGSNVIGVIDQDARMVSAVFLKLLVGNIRRARDDVISQVNVKRHHDDAMNCVIINEFHVLAVYDKLVLVFQSEWF